MADFHEQYAESEIQCEKPIKLDINDKTKYTVKEYKQKLFDDLLKRKKEVRKKIMNMNMKLNYNSKLKNSINNNINNSSNNINNNQTQQKQNLKVKKKKINSNTKNGK